MKVRLIVTLFLSMSVIGTPDQSLAETNVPEPALEGIRKVYVTGRHKHAVSWAKKRLWRFTCLTSVPIVEEADAILALEPVEYRPAAEIERTGGPITCTERVGQSDVKLTCADLQGAGTRVRCSTKPNGDTTCTAYYFDPLPIENALAESAHRSALAASTHAFLLSRDSNELLWEDDDSRHFANWDKKLKQACGCKSGERGTKP